MRDDTGVDRDNNGGFLVQRFEKIPPARYVDAFLKHNGWVVDSGGWRTHPDRGGWIPRYKPLPPWDDPDPTLAEIVVVVRWLAEIYDISSGKMLDQINQVGDTL